MIKHDSDGPRYYISSRERDEEERRVSPVNYTSRADAETARHELPFDGRRNTAVRSLSQEPLTLRMFGVSEVTFTRCQWEELLEQLNPNNVDGQENLHSRVKALLRLKEES